MAATRNTRSIKQAFTGFDATLKNLFIERPRGYALEIRRKLRDLPRTNFDLGCDFAAQGKWQDAAFRFRVALYFQPKFAAAHYNLGCCLMRLGQRAKAKGCFLRALQIQPGYSDALFMLSAIDPGAVPAAQRPQRMPSEMVLQFFDRMASNYDAIEAQNQYQGGRVAYDALKPHLNATKDLVVVDLACGTGIASRPWRPFAKELAGADFSPAMVNAAKLVKLGDAPLFDRVLEEDVFDVASSTAPLAEADVVLVVNAAQFLGNLEPLLKSLADKLKSGALVALTFEPFQALGGYGVNIDTGRFGHQPELVKQQAIAAGFAVKQEMRVNLYPNYPAMMLVLGK
jgi:predicted TPR repeat methyltransferase